MVSFRVKGAALTPLGWDLPAYLPFLTCWSAVRLPRAVGSTLGSGQRWLCMGGGGGTQSRKEYQLWSNPGGGGGDTCPKFGYPL